MMAVFDLLAEPDELVTVFTPTGRSAASAQLEMSAGTQPATGIDDGPAYELGARAPAPPWRALTNAEQRRLTASAPPRDYSRCVALLKLPRPPFTRSDRSGLAQ
ncbi:MAG: hypothetical protein ACXW3J_04220 [Methylocystis sp.]